ncbi:hypothetical protein CC78DRAFT_532498 [Lojkania enalia]|uniref:Mediator of RNA polymerase II transcription subunit 8 n=1 Tax=Lojkania enalia TaxID=147567 RepID=A0A9P4N8K6_9PLEO|nr:hypothetical protein CC78DRAFT_532498 [Didymosphaeria enalia]
MNQNAVQNISPDDIRALETLRQRLMPLVYNLQGFKAEMMQSGDLPLEWPAVQRNVVMLNSHVDSIQKFINDPADDRRIPKLLSSLHPYPIPPFPVEERNTLLETLLRKKAQPEDEKWIDERLRKAAEFCDVPKEWGIQSSKKDEGPAEQKENGKADEGEGDDLEDGDGAIKRVQGSLSEEELVRTWSLAGKWSEEQYQHVIERMYPDLKSEEDSEEDEEMEDVIASSSTTHRKLSSGELGEPGLATQLGQAGQVAQNAPTLAQQKALPLGSLLKFMSTGSA